ncbi:GPR1/FUN34/yaaH family-domain-containing protein [Fomitopsis betulina]|nr:GPR1/FUN34/yaaH family-domain-containing protein [Fomitopsis betulina]
MGGLAQFCAGMWEFASANTFNATMFMMYSSFWMLYATMFIPGSGVSAAYATVINDEATTLGIYIFMWSIITFLHLVASLRTNVGLIALFFFLTLMLSIAEFVPSAAAGCTKASGALDIITAFIVYYVGASQLLAANDIWFTLPLGDIMKHV